MRAHFTWRPTLPRYRGLGASPGLTTGTLGFAGSLQENGPQRGHLSLGRWTCGQWCRKAAVKGQVPRRRARGSQRCWDRDKTPPAPPGGSVRWHPKGGRRLAENKTMFAPLRVNIPPSCLLRVGRLCSLRRIGWERVWVRAPHSNALGSLHRQRGSFMISAISRGEPDPR